MLQALWPATLFKRDLTQMFSWEYCKIFTKSFFDRNSPVASVDLLFKSNVGGMVSTKKGRSGHSARYFNIISRSHSNTLLLINLQKPKTCPK